MKNKFLKKLGIIVLSIAIICGTASVSPVCVYAEDIQDTQNEQDTQDTQDTKVVADGGRAEEEGGAEYDLTDQGPVSGVKATNEAKVTVDSVEVTDTKDSEEQESVRDTVNVVDAEGGSEVNVNGDVNVTTQGTVGTQTTTAVSSSKSQVTIQGDIKVEDNMTYTLAEDEHYRNESEVIGIDSYDSRIDVGGDIVASSKNGTVYGVQLRGGTANINGSILISTEGAKHSAIGGVVASDATGEKIILTVDGDVNVNVNAAGGFVGIGLDMFDDSKAYIKGNITVEAVERAVGITIHDDSIAVIDGILSVKATNSDLNRLGMPYNPYEAGTGNSCLYVYKYVDETDYSSEDIDASYLSEEEIDFARLKYIIRTDEGLTTNANTFSDAELGVSEFYYSGEGEAITVSSNGATIYGIKNEDSSIDIKVQDNGNGTWTIIVPKGGGVHLQAILEKVEDIIEDIPGGTEKPEEGKGEITPPKTDAEGEITPPKTDAEGEITPPKTDAEGEITPPKTDTEGEVAPPKTDAEGEETHPETNADAEVTPSSTSVTSSSIVTELKLPEGIEALMMTQSLPIEDVVGLTEYVAEQAAMGTVETVGALSNTTITSLLETSELMTPVIVETVAMTQTQLAENVTGSAEYVAKQAEIEATMVQALDYVELMTPEQVENIKITGLSVDVGGCVVADAKVSQQIIRALSNGIPMNLTFRTNGSLIKFTIPAGFDMSPFIEVDGTIDFMKVFSAIQQRNN